MRHVLRIALTTAVAGAAVSAVVAAAIPIWLLFRVPPALVPPGAPAAPAGSPAPPQPDFNRSRSDD